MEISFFCPGGISSMKQPQFNVRFILIVLAIVLGTGMLLLVVISPLLRQVTETQDSIRENEAKLLEIAAEIANYKALSANLLKVSEQKAALADMFPPREQMVSLVLGLESAASRAGLVHKLTITDYKEKQEQNVGAKDKPPVPIISGLNSLEEIPYTLQAAENYRSLIDFLIYLEHQPFVTVFDKLTLSVDQTQSEGSENLRNTGTAAAKLDGVLFIKLP